MAGQQPAELTAILTALSPFVSTKAHKRHLPVRASTPHRRPVTPVPRSGTPRKVQDSLHPFTNMKICMLMDLHNSMSEPEQSLHLPRISDVKSDSISAAKKPM